MKDKLLPILRKTLIEFFDDLINILPSEKDLIIARIYIANQANISELMMKLSNKILPLQEIIKNRDDEFFRKNNSLFSDLNKKNVNYFRNIWFSENILDEDDKEAIWDWVDTITEILKRYNSN